MTKNTGNTCSRGVASYRPGETPRIVYGMSKEEKALVRRELAAEHILENVMLRSRWSVATRDKLAEALKSIIETEVEHRLKDEAEREHIRRKNREYSNRSRAKAVENRCVA